VLPDAGADDALYAGVDTLDDGEADRWHGRLGHLSLGRVHKTLKELGIKGYSARHNPKACHACLSNRRRNSHPRQPAGDAREKYPEFGMRIDTDIMGPMTESDHGFTYAINFVDRSSRLYAVYFMRGREHPNVLDAAKTFMEGPRTPTGGGGPMIGLKKMPDTESGFQNELLVQTGFQAGFGRISPRATTLQLYKIFVWIMRKKNEKKYKYYMHACRMS